MDTTPSRTQITFKDRHTAEKFLASISKDGGELPSAGKVELSWVKTPLPPVTQAAKPTIIKTEEDTNMDEGDAMAASSPARGAGGHAEGGQEQQDNLDYDVADENDWGIQ